MFFRMLISNVYKSVIVINSTETRFSRNWLKKKEILNPIKHCCSFIKHDFICNVRIFN